MKHVILVVVGAIAALVTVGWIANGHIERLESERDEARRQWCWLLYDVAVGPGSDGLWLESLAAEGDRDRYVNWCRPQSGVNDEQ